MTTKSYKAAKKRYSAKMTDKEKDKVKADVIAAGGSYKELSDEEVAAKESDTKPPSPKELGTVLKETGKKPKADKKPKAKEMPKTEMKPKAKGKPAADSATAQVPRKDSSKQVVDLERFKGTKKMDAITDAAEKENQDYLNSDEGKQVAKDSAEAKSLFKESSPGFTPGPGMSEAQAAEGKRKAETAPVALDGGVNISKGPETESVVNDDGGMPKGTGPKTESVVDDDGGMPKGKKSGGPYILNTDKTGKSEPVTGTRSQAKGTAAMSRIRRDRESGLRGFDPTTAPEGRGRGGPEFHDWSDEDAGITKSTPTATGDKPAKPSLGARLRGFLGGHDSAKGSPTPTPAGPPPSMGPTPTGGTPSTTGPTPAGPPPTAGPTPTTGSAPTSTRSQHFQGGHTVNQQGMGGNNNNSFNDYSGGGAPPAGGGSGSINTNNATIQANTGDGNTYGNVKGATINSGPTVASTAGKASSPNKNANVLSTGGPAAQTHPRAQNASRGGRPTTSKPKNPRTEKP